MSAMLTENNDKGLITKHTKHTQVQYFFIKDCIENGGFSLKYFLMGEIYADLLTKPLQGSMLQRFQAIVQIIP